MIAKMLIKTFRAYLALILLSLVWTCAKSQKVIVKQENTEVTRQNETLVLGTVANNDEKLVRNEYVNVKKDGINPGFLFLYALIGMTVIAALFMLVIMIMATREESQTSTNTKSRIIPSVLRG